MKKSVMSLPWTIFVLLSFLPACHRSEKKSPLPVQPASKAGWAVARVTVQTIQPQDVHYTVPAVGSLEADEVRIYARVSGPLTRLSFQEGDFVTAGKTILAQIDPELYALELAKALAEQDGAQARYLKAVEDDQKRRALFQKGVITQDEVTTYETAMKEAQASLKETVALSQLAEKNKREAYVRSPISGIIQSKHVVLGDYVKPDTLIATLLDLSTLRIRFSVSESVAVQLTLGQSITFQFDPLPHTLFAATIFHISASADPQTRLVECLAHHIRIAHTTDRSMENINVKGNTLPVSFVSHWLKPGYFVRLVIETAVHRQALVLPPESILPTEKGFVAFVLKGKKVQRRMVVPGLHEADGSVEILQGIHPNDTVITWGANALQDGMEVQVVPSLSTH